MSRENLFRLTAIVAVVAGVLRAIDSFAFEFMSSGASEKLFLVTDIFLLLALIGLYARLSGAIGWSGLLGFIVALVGIVMVRSAGDNIDAYVYGATVVAVGTAIFGATIIAVRAFPVIGPILWIVALIAGVGAYLVESDWAFEFAGVAFGLGFVLAGLNLFRRAA